MLLKAWGAPHDKLDRSRLAPGVILLASAGVALVATGLVLVWSHGAVLDSNNRLLVALAWCF
jgi:hypothetical protein